MAASKTEKAMNQSSAMRAVLSEMPNADNETLRKTIQQRWGIKLNPEYLPMIKSMAKKKLAENGVATAPAKRGPKPKVAPAAARRSAPVQSDDTFGCFKELMENKEVLNRILAIKEQVGDEKFDEMVSLLNQE